MELNKIHNKDCIEGMKQLEDSSIDLIVTDPPYSMTARGNTGTTGGMLLKDINRKGQVFENNDLKIKEYLSDFYRLLKDGSHCYIMTNHVNLIEFLKEIDKSDFHFIKSLVWDKGNKIMGQYYMSQFEYILFLRKGSGKKINNCGTSDILRVKNNKTKDKNGSNIHDTEKPVRLMKILIENSSSEGDIVLDPFMGSGTTAIACNLTNRKFIGYEIDSNYYHSSLRRLAKYDETYYDELPSNEKPEKRRKTLI